MPLTQVLGLKFGKLSWKQLGLGGRTKIAEIWALHKWHGQDGPQEETHWRINAVSISPHYIGNSLGRELMEKINDSADKV